MGIQDLFNNIKSTTTKIAELRGKTFAIDGHVLLHKCAYSCAKELVLLKNYNMIVNRIVTIVTDFLNISPRVILIFDGGFLPSKANTNQERQKIRDEATKNAIAAQQIGDELELMKQCRMAVGFTREQVVEISDLVNKKLSQKPNFFCFLSPYEADAQLAHLQKCGLADVLVSIDSDLLLYNPKMCLFKYDNYLKEGVLVENSGIYGDLFQSMPPSAVRKSCILSGCDYVKSLPGIGLKTACTKIRQQPLLIKAAYELLVHKQLNQPQYLLDVLNALFTFKYQTVFNFCLKKFAPLEPMTKDLEIAKFFQKNCGSCEIELEIAAPTEFMRESLKKLMELAGESEFEAQIMEEEKLEVVGNKIECQGVNVQVEGDVEEGKVDGRFRRIQDAIIRE